MADVKILEASHKAQGKLREVAMGLRSLARSFLATGNEYMASVLLDEAKVILDSLEAIKTWEGHSIHDSIVQSDLMTHRTFELAIAVATKGGAA